LKPLLRDGDLVRTFDVGDAAARALDDAGAVSFRA